MNERTRLSASDLQQLVWLLASALRRVEDREYYLGLAFHDDPDILDAIPSDAQESRHYALRLLDQLDSDTGHPTTRDGQSSLLVYLATMQADRGGAERGGDLAAKLQPYIELLRGAVGPEELERRIGAYLTGLVAGYAEQLRQQYVGLSGESRCLAPARSGTAPAGTGPRGPAPSGLGSLLDPYERDRRRAARQVLQASPPMVEGQYRSRDEGDGEAVADVCARLLVVQRGVLLGEPGSGKTFTLARLAVHYADAWYAAEPDRRVDGLVPVVVPLRAFSGQRDGKKLAFTDFVREQLNVLSEQMAFLARHSRLVFLCDALNEMPRRCALDGRDLAAEVREFLGDKPHFIVSCRVRDYRDDLGALGRLEQVRLLDLDLPKIREVIRHRLGAVGKDEALWEAIGGSEELLGYWNKVNEHQEPARFWDASAEVPSYTSGVEDAAWHGMFMGARLIPLCRNPYLLSLVCEIFSAYGTLPKRRVDLFRRFVKTLMRRESHQAITKGDMWPRTTLARVHDMLVQVAQAMQAAQVTTISRHAANVATGGIGNHWLLDVASAASILVEDDAGMVRFSHQLLQEYYAVRVLLAAMKANIDPVNFFQAGEGWWDPHVWRETTVLLGEFLGDGADGPNRAARWLAPASPDVALDVVLASGEGWSVTDVQDETRQVLITSVEAKTGDSRPPARAAAFRVLGRLGEDDREGVGLDLDGTPCFAWCEVPAGGFAMGSDRFAWEKPIHQVTLPTFFISKFPTTFAQYKAFLDAPDGYRNEQWWRKPVKLANREQNPGQQSWPIDNHPAENVSWYDAVAYCRWLTSKLGYEVRLPTEEEWEKAARGTDGREYPWGNEYELDSANIDEILGDYEVGMYYLEQTTAVGIYPKNVSPYGAMDMSGNVWERCSTKWRENYSAGRADNDSQGDSPRVERGGSWHYSRVAARAAFRVGDPPGLRLDNVGFRVVAVAPVP